MGCEEPACRNDGTQVFDVLQYLSANRLRVVSKDDLIEAVWGCA
jgi:DNA-binding winged helix-turn-helix (wHTH) protein